MDIAPYIDHTLLKPDASEQDIRRLCSEAVEYGFAAVCVNPCWVPFASEIVAGSGVKVCTVTAFPLGATSTEIKLAETGWCLEHGADVIDTVVNIGAVKDGRWSLVYDEISGIAELVHQKDAVLKVIFENALLDKSEIAELCRISAEAGADFVKTSTGFAAAGAITEHVRLMSDVLKGACLIKAAGGIRTFSDAVSMINAGASRIGTSAGTVIADEAAAVRKQGDK
jgi:deoxyribose-phosphate aldolase